MWDSRKRTTRTDLLFETPLNDVMFLEGNWGQEARLERRCESKPHCTWQGVSGGGSRSFGVHETLTSAQRGMSHRPQPTKESNLPNYIKEKSAAVLKRTSTFGFNYGISPEDTLLLNTSTSINNQSSCYWADGFKASASPRTPHIPWVTLLSDNLIFNIFIYITQKKCPKFAPSQETSKHCVLMKHNSKRSDLIINTEFVKLTLQTLSDNVNQLHYQIWLILPQKPFISQFH